MATRPGSTSGIKGALFLLSILVLSLVAPAQAAGARIIVLAQGYGQPDDLAWGPNGAIYFSDFGNSALNQLTPQGRKHVVLAELNKPEGIIVRKDGSIIIAEQGPNQLLWINPQSGAKRVLATIPNPSSRAGIDGIARDPHDGSLIVPDSPSGRVLRLTASGQLLRIQATGLGRPVSALALADGSMIVVDETLNAALHIDASGRVRQIGGFLSIPDDIVSDGAAGFYITCLGDNTLRHLDSNGGITLVAADLHNPQGLLRRPNGELIVAEEDANQIVAIQI